MDLNTLWILHNRIIMDSTQNDNNIENSLNKYDMTLYDDDKNIKDTVVILKEIDSLYSLLYSTADTIEEYTQLMITIREICIIIIGNRKSEEMYNFYINMVSGDEKDIK